MLIWERTVDDSHYSCALGVEGERMTDRNESIQTQRKIISAATVRRVYQELLDRDPEYNQELTGVSELDFVLSVAQSPERTSLVLSRAAREAPSCDYQISSTDLGPMVTHIMDRGVGGALRNEGRFEEADIANANELLLRLGHEVRKSTFLDIGANIGTHGLYAAKLGFKRVVSVEPDDTNFRLLRANQALNGEAQTFVNIHSAVSNVDGEGVLELSTDNYGDHRLRSIEGPSKDSDVFDESCRSIVSTRIAKLDTLLSEVAIDPRDIDLVWMDTQGYEGHALAGANCLRTAKTPLVSEFWPYGLKRSGGYPLLRDALLNATGIYDMTAMRNSGTVTSLSLDDLDNVYENLLRPEENRGIGWTDILVLY